MSSLTKNMGVSFSHESKSIRIPICIIVIIIIFLNLTFGHTIYFNAIITRQILKLLISLIIKFLFWNLHNDRLR